MKRIIKYFALILAVLFILFFLSCKTYDIQIEEKLVEESGVITEEIKEEIEEKPVGEVPKKEVEEQLFKPLSGIIKNIIPLGLFKEVLKDKSSYKDSNIIHRLKEKLLNLKNFR